MEGLLEKTAESHQLSASYPVFSTHLPSKVITAGDYQVSFVSNPEDLLAIERLRFATFNHTAALQEGIDEDQFDAVCHHLWVRHLPTQKIVGTYRMQISEMANAFLGFYSDQEFCLSHLPASILSNAVEIGRACVDAKHRNGRVLQLLWRGLAMYLAWNKKRYLFGCSSFFSQDIAEGYGLLKHFNQAGFVHDEIFVETRPAYACSVTGEVPEIKTVPRLLRVYMMYGAKVCSLPALDKNFKTIDFLTLFDVEDLSERAYAGFFKD